MKQEIKELIYNIVNCSLAGILVFLGGISTGKITSETFIIAVIASLITFCTQFKNYWDEEKEEWTKQKKLLTFL